MNVSAIIATKNRAFELAIVVRDLLNQTHPPTEIIIIDQSTDDFGERVVTTLFEATPTEVRDQVRLKYVLDPAVSGLTAARNRSIELASGEISLFLDDDVEFGKNFVEEIASVFRERPEVAGVGGVITNYIPPPWPFRLWTRIFALGPLYDERQPIYWNAKRANVSGPIRVQKLTGAAMAFRSELVRELRFDSNLTGYSVADDVDFTARIETGIIVIAPGARLIHKRSPTNRATDHWLRAQAEAVYYLYPRNWRYGLTNRLRFMWLNVGYALAIIACCLKQRSSAPLAAFREGMRRARAVLTQPGEDQTSSRIPR
jgi:GT2 family glycosyltransferase